MIDFNSPMPLSASPNDLLTVGEIVVDMIADDYREDAAPATGYHSYIGGSPTNIAMNANKLGLSVMSASALGHDLLGDFLENQLVENGLSAEGLQRVNHVTSMVVLNRSQRSPIPAFYRDADRFLAYTGWLDSALSQSKILHFSCWPVSCQPSRSTIEKLLDEAKATDILVGFDPNYHPALWEDGDNGVGYIMQLLSRVDIAKPSEDDAERIFGQGSPETQVKRFLSCGVKLVILTLGENGLIASNGTETVEMESLAGPVVDTTGAGDAFWSGFYAAAVKGYPIRQALRLGLAVSSYKLGYCGAVVDLPPLSIIHKKYLQNGSEGL